MAVRKETPSLHPFPVKVDRARGSTFEPLSQPVLKRYSQPASPQSLRPFYPLWLSSSSRHPEEYPEKARIQAIKNK